MSVRNRSEFEKFSDQPKAGAGGFVSFVSSRSEHFRKFSPLATDHAERAALCCDDIPPAYVNAWTRLCTRPPDGTATDEWNMAISDGARFFAAWGEWAARWNWTEAELFDLPHDGALGGLLWFIQGRKVEAFGPDHCRLEDEAIFDRGTVGGERIIFKQ
ncbi:hypothetical protein CH337_04250 [Rhodoblastus acidophilus]|nr:hypothetical protein CKO16_01580 [Rhodoblastus acidophilus]RAI23052.1 hypothetical protein CH337_04250 [Rhodoblastus acidophilus]